ncbi:ABC transporter permease [Dongia sp.]|uniref:ABC transporter permease n=1 Tax=Dongia sp. TaxID=1977262 RepID=UPI0035AFE397
MNFLTFLQYNGIRVVDLTLGHIELSLYAVGIALVIGMPLGILCHSVRALANIILSIISIIYTVPTLALFGIMIPLLGIGIVPALVAIVLYSLLPVVQNTATGLAAVPADVREAATGIGMGPGTRLLRVELPMAFPVILAGIRIAVVNAIGMVTLASLIGAGGLGDLIFRGISTVSWPFVIFGSLPVLALALVADLGLKNIERRLTADPTL